MATERVGWIEISVVSGLIVLVESGMMLADRWVADVAPMIVLAVGRILEIILIFMVFRTVQGDAPAIGLRGGEFVSGLLRGIFWAGGFGLGVVAVGVLMALAGYAPLNMIHSRLPGDGGSLVRLFLVGGLIGPVAEEFLFRGALFGFLRQWGAPVAVIGSTVCFVVLHPGFGSIQAIGGLLFAVSYEVEKSLWVPIVLHTTGNTALFALSLLG